MKRYIVVFLLLFSFGAISQAVLTPDDVAKLKYVLSVTLSDDGTLVAYLQTNPADPRKENSPTSVHLYLYDVENERSFPFVTQQSVSNVAFRPGNNSITFTSRRGDDKVSSLYEIPLSGGEAQQLYSFDTSISEYQWHPEGDKLAFIASLKNETKSELPYEPEIYEENLSKSALYVIDFSGELNPVMLETEKHLTGVKWSPDGEQLAISAAPSSLVDDYYTSQQIHIVNGTSLKIVQTIDHTAKLGEFLWSPDGKNIAFIGGADKHDPIDGRLLLGNPKTGTVVNLSPKDFEGQIEDIQWKDNKTLHLLASEGVYTSFGIIDLKGKMTKQIDKGNTSFNSFSAAKNGTVAMAGSTAEHPGELFISRNSGQPERKTVSNVWLSEITLGKQEVVSYTTSDGMIIEGIFINPVNVKSGEKPPMITVVHGGPEAHYDNGWLTGYSSPGQVAAGKGYAVFYPNYRGSTGRGLKFAMSSQGDPAGKEFDDIIEGLDDLIENKNVDADRIGVTGGSYGGYATGWMATRYTDRFAAGVMFVGISNNLSKWGTSDIPEEMFLVHSRKRIWEDYQFFLERSPIYYAGQAKTPLLIMAGKEDTRVDPGQSYELYRHIKTRTDTPVRLVLYPGEGHGNRRATARYDYNLRMMRWFDTYLKNESNKIPETKVELEGQ